MEISNLVIDQTCPHHGAYKAKIIHFNGKEIGGHCPTCEAEKTAKDAERKLQIDRADQVRRIEGLFQRAGIPLRFQKRTFANYEATNEGQAAALRKSKAYADNWPEVIERGTCLIFSGHAGTGKTHLACAIANELMGRGVSSLFTTVSDAMRAIKRTYDSSSSMTEAQAIASFVDPRLLILDEVGGSKGTDHELQLMFDIINKRYENCRPTIILTNLDPTALREHLGERVMDRLREGGGKLVIFGWNSHRS